MGRRGRRRERERKKRGTDLQSERLSVGQKWKWRGSEMAVRAIGYINCQSNWVGFKFISFSGSITFVLITLCFVTAVQWQTMSVISQFKKLSFSGVDAKRRDATF